MIKSYFCAYSYVFMFLTETHKRSGRRMARSSKKQLLVSEPSVCCVLVSTHCVGIWIEGHHYGCLQLKIKHRWTVDTQENVLSLLEQAHAREAFRLAELIPRPPAVVVHSSHSPELSFFFFFFLSTIEQSPWLGSTAGVWRQVVFTGESQSTRWSCGWLSWWSLNESKGRFLCELVQRA